MYVPASGHVPHLGYPRPPTCHVLDGHCVTMPCLGKTVYVTVSCHVPHLGHPRPPGCHVLDGHGVGGGVTGQALPVKAGSWCVIRTRSLAHYTLN